MKNVLPFYKLNKNILWRDVTKGVSIICFSNLGNMNVIPNVTIYQDLGILNVYILIHCMEGTLTYT